MNFQSYQSLNDCNVYRHSATIPTVVPPTALKQIHEIVSAFTWKIVLCEFDELLNSQFDLLQINFQEWIVKTTTTELHVVLSVGKSSYCNCGFVYQFDLPCKHIMAVFAHQTVVVPDVEISPRWRVNFSSTQLSSDSVMQSRNLEHKDSVDEFGAVTENLKDPIDVKKRGRPAGTSRILSKFEVQPKRAKSSRKCSKCHKSGYDARTCTK